MIAEIISSVVIGIIVFWMSTDLYKALKNKK